MRDTSIGGGGLKPDLMSLLWNKIRVSGRRNLSFELEGGKEGFPPSIMEGSAGCEGEDRGKDG